MLELSSRVEKLKPSSIRKVIPYGNKALEKGIKIYYLNIGQPDIKTPKIFYEAIKEYNEPVLKYAPSSGLKELTMGIESYYKKRGINYESDDILIVNGGTEAISFALTAVCNYGDEVLMIEPYYANYNTFCELLGIKIETITTCAEDGFHLPKIEEFEKKITSKTKAIMLSNPSNPTGVIYTKDEMNIIKKIALENNLFIISDEVYREFFYDSNEPISFGSFKEIEDRVIIIDSISKRYSACGARIGCVISKNKDVMKGIFKLCQARLAVSTLDMVGAAALYKLPDSYFDIARKEYSSRREILHEELKKIPGIVSKKSEGAFYSVVKLPIKNAENFVIWLLEEYSLDNETVMLTPAEGFYKTEGLGENEIRISYAVNSEYLIRAINILKNGLDKYIKLQG